MAAIRVLRKLNLGIFGSRGFSSRSWNVSETCLIRGVTEDISFPATLFEPLDEHMAKFPLVTAIPKDKLIVVDPERPFEITDHWRHLLYTGFLHSYLCKSQKDSISNAFDFANVGVLKDIDVLCFKKLDRVEGKLNADHGEFTRFVEEVFRRFCGPEALQEQFPECHEFLQSCSRGEEGDDDVLRHHSFFLEDESMAELYSDIHRLVRHEFKHRLKGRQAIKILTEMSRHFCNLNVVRECMRHRLLQFLLGSHSPVERKRKCLDGDSDTAHPPIFGSAVIDLHRISVHHAIEDNTLGKVRFFYPHEDETLWKKYSRIDVIKALRYQYATYPSKALFAFKDANVFQHLGMQRRLPMLNLYNYVSPSINENKDPQGGTGYRNN